MPKPIRDQQTAQLKKSRKWITNATIAFSVITPIRIALYLSADREAGTGEFIAAMAEFLLLPVGLVGSSIYYLRKRESALKAEVDAQLSAEHMPS